MRTALIAAAFAFVSSTASAQALHPLAPIAVDILRGYELIGPITLTPETPGDELLFRNKLWKHVIVVAVPHGSKSGVGGLIPAPGLCIEPAQAFAFFDPQITIADVNGDGLQDVIGIREGEVQPLMGSRLTACR